VTTPTSKPTPASGAVRARDPRTGEPTGESFTATGAEGVDRAVRAAAAALPGWAALGARGRAAALEAAADALDAATDGLVALADAETALGAPRLTGEVARTTGQLRLFAEVLREGSYAGVILTPADPAAGRPDLRRMLQPIGPVAVYAASNFPFAFSVAGGDTAAALAAGCPVVVKAHEGHPGTSAAVAGIVADALAEAGAPEGTLALVHGFDAGVALVQHPVVRAAAFTGSQRGGRALHDLAAARPEPIPFFGELGSVNPVVVLPGAARARGAELARGYAASLTLGSGQFCTNPGLIFVPEESGLAAAVGEAVTGSGAGPLLTAAIEAGYRRQTAELDGSAALTPLATGTADPAAPHAVAPRAWYVTLDAFAADLDTLREECFGPAGLVVGYLDPADLEPVLARLGGSLTASVHTEPGDEGDRAAAGRLGAVLARTAGRLVHNGWPTGVAVCWAMHHGGPYPATTAPHHTSVGATSIARFLVPVAYQDWPDELLPDELKDANPLGLPRRTA
jgi:NADP-dependent aldehyde dehydrogenase